MSTGKALRVDTASSTVTYVGEAATAITEAASFWKIKRLTTVGTVLKIEWADGNEDYDNVWNDRTSLTYS